MKAYSFYFNTSDWLASPTVKMMSKAERGVYIGLLASAWESPVQGTLPASVDKVRRLAEMSLDEWAESGETLLEKFPLSGCGTYRYNPRLLAEAAKEQARSDKAKKSADMRWQSERNANASKNNANASEKVCERNAQVKDSKVKEREGKPSSELRSPREEKVADQFTSFWQAYPRKESRMDALKAFNKLSVDEQTTATQSVIEWFARRTDWIRADGSDFRPHASSWLNQKRWTELTEITITPIPQSHGNPTATAQTNGYYQRSNTAPSQFAYTDNAAFSAALQIIKELG